MSIHLDDKVQRQLDVTFTSGYKLQPGDGLSHSMDDDGEVTVTLKRKGKPPQVWVTQARPIAICFACTIDDAPKLAVMPPGTVLHYVNPDNPAPIALAAEAPAVPADRFELSFDDGNLTIPAEHRITRGEDGKYHIGASDNTIEILDDKERTK